MTVVPGEYIRIWTDGPRVLMRIRPSSTEDKQAQSLTLLADFEKGCGCDIEIVCVLRREEFP